VDLATKRSCEFNAIDLASSVAYGAIAGGIFARPYTAPNSRSQAGPQPELRPALLQGRRASAAERAEGEAERKATSFLIGPAAFTLELQSFLSEICSAGFGAETEIDGDKDGGGVPMQMMASPLV